MSTIFSSSQYLSIPFHPKFQHLIQSEKNDGRMKFHFVFFDYSHIHFFTIAIQLINVHMQVCNNTTLVPIYWMTFSRSIFTSCSRSSFFQHFSPIIKIISILIQCICVENEEKKIFTYFYDRIIFQLNQGIRSEPIVTIFISHTCCHPSLILVVCFRASSIFVISIDLFHYFQFFLTK